MIALRLLATALMLGMTGGQALAGGCGYSYYNSSYYYPQVIEKIVYVSTYYPAYVPVNYATYVPPPIVPLVPLGQLTPVAPGVAPAPIAVAPIVPVAAPAVAAVDPCAVKVEAAMRAMEARMAKRFEALDRENADLRARMAPMAPETPGKELGKERLQPEGVAPPKENRLGGVAVLNLKCASCHAADQASVIVDKGAGKLKGGGFVMFQPRVVKDAPLEPVTLKAGQIADVYDRILLPVEDKDHMPPGDTLTQEQGQALLVWLGSLRKAAKQKG